MGIAALCRVSTLRVLSLAGNHIPSVDSGLQLCSGLQELHLERNLISAVSPEAFWGMEKLKVGDPLWRGDLTSRMSL